MHALVRWYTDSMSHNMNYGISLTGGGARGSYQAGVLKGLAEVLKSQGLVDDKNPFQYWSGVSAGSINAAACVAGLDHLPATIDRLVDLWSNIRPEDVYLTDFASLSINGMKWARDLTLGSLLNMKRVRSLLDTKPLWDYLAEQIHFSRIDSHLKEGRLKGLACSAYSCSDNRTITFLQTLEDVSWNRHRRSSQKCAIRLEHIMASCSIPLLFPSVKIGDHYYADGGFRSLSPISPLIHLGAQKILIIGVRGRDEFSEKRTIHEPGVAKMAGAILNALFFDTIEIDLERVRHINELLTATQLDLKTERSSYSILDYMVIRPSRDVSRMALERAEHFPRLIKFLLGGLGPIEESAELASYILFVSAFTKDLIDLGYNDMMKQKSALLKWLDNSSVERKQA